MARQNDLDRLYIAWRDLAKTANNRLPSQQSATQAIKNQAISKAGGVPVRYK